MQHGLLKKCFSQTLIQLRCGLPQIIIEARSATHRVASNIEKRFTDDAYNCSPDALN